MKNDFFKTTMVPALGITGLALLIVAILVVTPLLTLWVLNTLFGLSIAYTFKTWAAAAIFNILFAVRLR